MSTAAATAWVPPSTFGTRLAMVRHHLGLQQKVIAAKCGVDNAAWSYWEKGGQPRNLAQVARQISGATGVDIGWLVFGDPPDQGERQTACFTAVSHPRFSRTTANLAGLAVPA